MVPEFNQPKNICLVKIEHLRKIPIILTGFAQKKQGVCWISCAPSRIRSRFLVMVRR
jgi:hypothetical protein